MSDLSAREMTHDEWAKKLVGKEAPALANALMAAEARGRRKGRASMEPSARHFETAYRYAVNSHRDGADKADLLASAEIFANIGYAEMKETK
jgi:hypothetical protein